jgi:hypothetical protein
VLCCALHKKAAGVRELLHELPVSPAVVGMHCLKYRLYWLVHACRMNAGRVVPVHACLMMQARLNNKQQGDPSSAVTVCRTHAS